MPSAGPAGQGCPLLHRRPCSGGAGLRQTQERVAAGCSWRLEPAHQSQPSRRNGTPSETPSPGCPLVLTEESEPWLWPQGNEVTQSCPTLCDPMDYSLPGSSVHGIFEARILEWVAISFCRVFPTEGLNLWLLPRLLHCRRILYC